MGTNEEAFTYTYNSDGIRTSKTVDGVEHIYTLDGAKILSESWGEHLNIYLYDESDTPIGFVYRNSSYAEDEFDTYVFEKNLQGDIVTVYDEEGKKLTAYYYDAWGNVTQRHFSGGQGTSVVYNPFKYRGYYHDSETGLYYLNSRYYDPATGRFINADSQLNHKDGIIGYSMYAYCCNNPVIYFDPTGHSITLTCIIIGAVIGAIAGGSAGAYISYKQTGEVNGFAVAVGIVGGGIVGGLIGWGIGAAITTFGSVATGTSATTTAPVIYKVGQEMSTAIQTYYPPNNGFSGTVQQVTLEIGTLIQRTGELYGYYVAPAGTPTQMLSLPYDKIGQVTTTLIVEQPIEVISGTVAPWFGQIGGGIQYLLQTPLDQLISQGIIRIFGG